MSQRCQTYEKVNDYDFLPEKDELSKFKDPKEFTNVLFKRVSYHYQDGDGQINNFIIAKGFPKQDASINSNLNLKYHPNKINIRSFTDLKEDSQNDEKRQKIIIEAKESWLQKQQNPLDAMAQYTYTIKNDFQKQDEKNNLQNAYQIKNDRFLNQNANQNNMDQNSLEQKVRDKLFYQKNCSFSRHKPKYIIDDFPVILKNAYKLTRTASPLIRKESLEKRQNQNIPSFLQPTENSNLRVKDKCNTDYNNTQQQTILNVQNSTIHNCQHLSKMYTLNSHLIEYEVKNKINEKSSRRCQSHNLNKLNEKNTLSGLNSRGSTIECQNFSSSKINSGSKEINQSSRKSINELNSNLKHKFHKVCKKLQNITSVNQYIKMNESELAELGKTDEVEQEQKQQNRNDRRIKSINKNNISILKQEQHDQLLKIVDIFQDTKATLKKGFQNDSNNKSTFNSTIITQSQNNNSSLNTRFQTPNARVYTQNSRNQITQSRTITPNSKIQTTHSIIQSPNDLFYYSNQRCQTSEGRPQTSNPRNLFHNSRKQKLNTQPDSQIIVNNLFLFNQESNISNQNQYTSPPNIIKTQTMYSQPKKSSQISPISSSDQQNQSPRFNFSKQHQQQNEGEENHNQYIEELEGADINLNFERMTKTQLKALHLKSSYRKMKNIQQDNTEEDDITKQSIYQQNIKMSLGLGQKIKLYNYMEDDDEVHLNISKPKKFVRKQNVISQKHQKKISFVEAVRDQQNQIGIKNLKLKYGRPILKLYEFLQKCIPLRVCVDDIIEYKVFTTKPFERPGSYIFFKMVKQNQFDNVKNQIQECRWRIFDFDHMMMTALHVSIIKGHKEMAVYIIDQLPDLEAEDIDNKTPLWYAIKTHQYDIAKYLLINRASPWANDNFKYYDIIEDIDMRSSLKVARLLYFMMRATEYRKRQKLWEETKNKILDPLADNRI